MPFFDLGQLHLVEDVARMAYRFDVRSVRTRADEIVDDAADVLFAAQPIPQGGHLGLRLFGFLDRLDRRGFPADLIDGLAQHEGAIAHLGRPGGVDQGGIDGFLKLGMMADQRPDGHQCAFVEPVAAGPVAGVVEVGALVDYRRSVLKMAASSSLRSIVGDLSGG